MCEHHHSLLNALSPEESLVSPGDTTDLVQPSWPFGFLIFSSSGGFCVLGVGSIRKQKREEVLTSWLDCIWCKLPGIRGDPRYLILFLIIQI